MSCKTTHAQLHSAQHKPNKTIEDIDLKELIESKLCALTHRVNTHAQFVCLAQLSNSHD